VFPGGSFNLTTPPSPPIPPSSRAPKSEPFKVDLFRGRSAAIPPSLNALSQRLESMVPPRERAARWIGQMLVVIFGITTLVIILYGFHIISAHSSKDDAKSVVNEALIPFLEKVATFMTTVFSPLLAFILGYYFGQKQSDKV
jgi:hypothetical protein